MRDRNDEKMERKKKVCFLLWLLGRVEKGRKENGNFEKCIIL